MSLYRWRLTKVLHWKKPRFQNMIPLARWSRAIRPIPKRKSNSKAHRTRSSPSSCYPLYFPAPIDLLEPLPWDQRKWFVLAPFPQQLFLYCLTWNSFMESYAPSWVRRGVDSRTFYCLNIVPSLIMISITYSWKSMVVTLVFLVSNTRTFFLNSACKYEPS